MEKELPNGLEIPKEMFSKKNIVDSLNVLIDARKDIYDGKEIKKEPFLKAVDKLLDINKPHFPKIQAFIRKMPNCPDQVADFVTYDACKAITSVAIEDSDKIYKDGQIDYEALEKCMVKVGAKVAVVTVKPFINKFLLWPIFSKGPFRFVEHLFNVVMIIPRLCLAIPMYLGYLFAMPDGNAIYAMVKDPKSAGKKMLSSAVGFIAVWCVTLCPVMYGWWKSMGYLVDEKPPPPHWTTRWLEKCKKHKWKVGLGATLVSGLGGYGIYRWWNRNADDSGLLLDDDVPSGARRRSRKGLKPRKRPDSKKSSWSWIVMPLVLVLILVGVAIGCYFYCTQDQTIDFEPDEADIEEGFGL